jgi:plastocyanin
MRKALFVLVTVLGITLVGCSSDDDGGPTTPTGGETAAITGSTGATAATGGTATATGATSDCVDLTGEGPVFTITISGFAFQPDCFTASAAQGISVVNQDQTGHTFTMVGTPVDAAIPAGETFNGEPITGVVEPGTYDLVCRIHPTMTGEVTVVA